MLPHHHQPRAEDPHLRQTRLSGTRTIGEPKAMRLERKIWLDGTRGRSREAGRSSLTSSFVVSGSGQAGARKEVMACWVSRRRCWAASASARLTVGVTSHAQVSGFHGCGVSSVLGLGVRRLVCPVREANCVWRTTRGLVVVPFRDVWIIIFVAAMQIIIAIFGV